MDARRATRIIWAGTGFLCLVGVAAVTRRLLSLTGAVPATGPKLGLDDGFARHATLTTIHIIPGLLFMLLAPLQFVKRMRTSRPALHRWIGRTVVTLGMVIGGSALVMSPQMAIGGPTETAATMLFGCLFLFAMLRGFIYIRRGNRRLHREWMIRAFAIGMAVATIRPIVGLFFATSRLTHLTPRDFFGIAFWLGFTIQAVVAEMWIRHTRSQRLASEISSSGFEGSPRFAQR
jgi:uncharacterized membrane protein